MKIKFTVLGEPMGKQRPKFSRRGSCVHTYPTAKYWYAYMRIYEGVNVDGITIYPMIRPSDIKNSDFEPYKPSITDYIAELEARITALEASAAEVTE